MWQGLSTSVHCREHWSLSAVREAEFDRAYVAVVIPPCQADRGELDTSRDAFELLFTRIDSIVLDRLAELVFMVTKGNDVADLRVNA